MSKGNPSSFGVDSDENPKFVRENPYYRPIVGFAHNIWEIRWQFPYVPNLIQAGIISAVILILCCLYATVGIASQISNTFLVLIEDASRRIHHGSSIEKSAYVVAIGIYLTLFVPFWLVQSPFQFLGWCWGRFGMLTFMIIVIIGLCGYGFLSERLSAHGILELLKEWFSAVLRAPSRL